MDRSRRLRRGPEFDTAYQKGTVVRGPLLIVRGRRSGLARTRWGFAVGRRLVAKAHDRNRVRRRLREAARWAGVGEGWDIVVVAREGAVAARFEALVEEVRRLVRRLVREEGKGGSPTGGGG
ncbi:ribonuclease P protein component [Tepidiforma sp.]|uniref:ribonuclease P protein component n=1 Tax=Tepidiforma sp. TaxID=2682230 RepID=UPI002ADE3346|nr:ribonuclease P protein component [Tepidiforma sp.]